MPRLVYNCSPNEWLTPPPIQRIAGGCAGYRSGTVTMKPGVWIGLRCSGD